MSRLISIPGVSRSTTNIEHRWRGECRTQIATPVRSQPALTLSLIGADSQLQLRLELGADLGALAVSQ
jgi:hypothetical protein